MNKSIINYHNFFTYKEGVLFWKISICRRIRTGSIAGSLGKDGYRTITIYREREKEHRIVWTMFNGPIPSGMWIDHIDRNKINNKIENLRLSTPRKNMANQEKPHGTFSKFKGVHKGKNKYRVRISEGKKQITVGNYISEIDAAMAYDKKAIEIFGEFALTNQKLYPLDFT